MMPRRLLSPALPQLLLCFALPASNATHALQSHASGSAAGCLCGLLLRLHHQLAACSRSKQEGTGSKEAAHQAAAVKEVLLLCWMSRVAAHCGTAT